MSVLLSPNVGCLRRSRHHTGAGQRAVMAVAEALLEYASGGRTYNDRESAQWSSAGQTEAIELSGRGRLQCHGTRAPANC